MDRVDAIKLEGGTTIKQEILDIKEVYYYHSPIKDEPCADVKTEILDIKEVYNCHSPIKDEPCADVKTEILDIKEVYNCHSPIKDEPCSDDKKEILDIKEVYYYHSPIKDEPCADVKTEILDIKEVYNCHSPIKDEPCADVKTEILDISEVNNCHSSIKDEPCSDDKTEILDIKEVYYYHSPVKDEPCSDDKTEILDISKVSNCHSPIKDEPCSDDKTEILDISKVSNCHSPIKDEPCPDVKTEILDIKEVYYYHSPIKDEPCADVKTEILDIKEFYYYSPIKDEPCSDDKTGLDASCGTLSVANASECTCHHCGYEADCLDDMRRHMRRHRGLTVGDQVSRVEEVGRDTSMCRGQGEVSRSRDVKRSKRGHTGGTSSVANIGVLVCPHCGCEADCLDDMRRHMRRHRGLSVGRVEEVRRDTSMCRGQGEASQLKDVKRGNTGETLSVANAGVLVCPHCGCEADCLDDMRRHMRRHRGLSVGRVEEVGRDTSMCRGQGEVSRSRDVKRSKRGHTGGTSSVANTGVLVCPHCGCEADCLDDMRRHMRRHRGLSVGRVEEVRRDTSMCRDQGEASQLKDVKRGNTGGALSGANTGVLVCHHCGCEADCLDDMRRHMRRHRGLSVGRVEEVRRDTSMCRGQGEARRSRDVKRSKRGNTGEALSVANAGVLVCHHCGHEADCLDNMRRHMRRHRGLSVGRVEEVRRDTSMCRGQGEASKLKDVKRGNTGGALSGANTGVLVCHHCGCEADCLDDMRRHMRRHRGLSVGRVEEVRRDTSMCRGQGEARRSRDVKRSKRGNTGEALSVANAGVLVCHHCGHEADCLDNMRRHMRRHRGLSVGRVEEVRRDTSMCRGQGEASKLKDVKRGNTGGALSGANTGVLVCHHCGCEADCLDDMRRHMRRHRGLSVGRVEEVRRDTSMCRGQGEARRSRDVKRSKRGNTGEALSVANAGVLVCHHCGHEADCLDNMRRHMRRHRGLSVGRVEEVRRDTSMCRGQGEASKLKDVKRGNTGGALSGANTGVLVCHHCGCEADCLDDMRRHMRRHRGLSVGRVEEVRRDTSMCRGQGEARRSRDVKRSKRGNTGEALSVANAGVLVCHHCGHEADCLDNMRRHMRRHRGLSVGRVEEVRRDTSMCRGQGEASKLKDVKRGNTGETLSVANAGVLVCHHCGHEADCLDDMRRHMRRHRGLSVGRVEEVRRDTSMCRDQGEASQLKDVKRGNTGGASSVANTGVLVCHHCGCEVDCLDDMRRHMRRHRGLPVGDQVSRAEEVRRDTSMCRGQGEASRSRDVKSSKRGNTGEALSVANAGVLVCHYCGCEADCLDDMRRHMRRHRGLSVGRVEEVRRDTSMCRDQGEASQLKDVKRGNTGGALSGANTGVLVCHHCGCEADCLDDMRRHMRRHRGLSVGDHVSRVEEVRRGTSMCRGQRSKRSHTVEKRLSCDQCNYRTHNSRHLKMHKLIHTGEKPFSCDLCDFRTRQLSHLTRHRIIHTGEKPFSCDLCDYKSRRLNSMKRHKTTHANEKLFSCGTCEFRSSDLRYIRRHRKVHPGKNTFKCDRCTYRTDRLTNLTRHELVHTGEKPLSCSRCSYRTGRSASMARHKLIHTGEKPLSCDRCNYRTGLSSSLKRHKLVHTGEKPYSCDRCDYRASRLALVTRHKAVHTGEKPS